MAPNANYIFKGEKCLVKNGIPTFRTMGFK